jgi:hypothetical protein
MDKTWSWDSPWDFVAMSNYNTVTSLAESPLLEGLVYAGTDDGLIQVTEDGGRTWRAVEVGSLPGVPETAFVNDLKADLFDVNTVYVCLDNHKFGDLRPYLLKSTDRGRKWRSIKGNIPDRTLVWRLVQDHVKPELLFAGTEFGVFFTIDGGERWIKLSGGVPTISFRDLAIQRREDDLVGATFGRGFYVFDDYSVLRQVSEEQLEREATLFPVRKAWWYVERPVLGFSKKATQGAAHYAAENPPFGAVFTYYLREALKMKKAVRSEVEKKLIEEEKDVPFGGWEEMEAERRQSEPVIWLTVRDADGRVARRIKGPVEKGFHRVAWDLRFPATSAIRDAGPDDEARSGVMAAPGGYTVVLSKQMDGVITDLSDPVAFTVEPMRMGALKGAAAQDVAAFWQRTASLQRATTAASVVLANTLERVDAMRIALSRTPAPPGDLDTQLHGLRQMLLELDEQMNGNRAKRSVGEKIKPTIVSRLSLVMRGTSRSTYGPTPNLERSLEVAETEFEELRVALDRILNEQLPVIEKALMRAGAPWVGGQPIPEN